VILQEGQPAPGRVTATAGVSQITSDSPLVDDKTKLLQLTVNLGSTPTTVDFRNPWTFGKVSSDPRTASIGGQPLMNLTLAIFS
jgi:Flp pilus assembly protein TadG